MKDVKEISTIILGISIVAYLLAVVFFRGAYDEAVGDVRIFGRLLTVQRSWRECLLCIGCSLLFMLFINIIKVIADMDFARSEIKAESSTALQCLAAHAKVAVVEVLRMFLGVAVSFVEGMMFVAVLLGKCHYIGAGEVLLFLSCVAMVMYAVTEGIVAVQKEQNLHL